MIWASHPTQAVGASPQKLPKNYGKTGASIHATYYTPYTQKALVLVYKDFLTTAEARDQPSQKLRPKWFGPYPIIKKIGPNAYQLDLPSAIRCHPVFNITALRRYEQNTIPGRRQPPPPPFTDLNGQTRYMVERVLDDRQRRHQTQYLVKWQGYPDDEATWEPEGNLLDEAGRPIVALRRYRASRAC